MLSFLFLHYFYLHAAFSSIALSLANHSNPRTLNFSSQKLGYVEFPYKLLRVRFLEMTIYLPLKAYYWLQ